jgi:hypothetical protein
MGTGRRTRRSDMKMLAAVGVIAAASALSACSSPTSRFDDAIAQGIAAVETARLAVDLQLDDRIYAATTNTALGDARRELVDASTSVSETDATTESDAALRADLLDALTLGVDAVNDARDAMAGIGSLENSVAPLEDAAAALEELERAADALDAAEDTGGSGR